VLDLTIVIVALLLFSLASLLGGDGRVRPLRSVGLRAAR
jgi:hypothetical protein